MQFISQSSEETKDFAKDLSKKYLEKNIVITLKGDLGAGKTTFVQGFAQGLGLKQKILSPTFIVCRQYPLDNRYFYHLDLYRFEEGFDTINSGVQEILDSQNIVLIEWPERLGKKLPSNCVKIDIKIISENEREITVDE